MILKKVASIRGASQEIDVKFRFAIHPQGIRQFHDNCQIAKCQTGSDSVTNRILLQI